MCLGEVLLRTREPNAPNRATPAASSSAGDKEWLASAIMPATLGPAACPTPKKSVIKPSPAGASLGPSKSPHVAAIIAGILQAVRPNRTAERMKPGDEGQSANKPKAAA